MAPGSRNKIYKIRKKDTMIVGASNAVVGFFVLFEAKAGRFLDFFSLQKIGQKIFSKIREARCFWKSKGVKRNSRKNDNDKEHTTCQAENGFNPGSLIFSEIWIFSRKWQTNSVFM